jgi:hypothetical protein
MLCTVSRKLAVEHCPYDGGLSTTIVPPVQTNRYMSHWEPTCTLAILHSTPNRTRRSIQGEVVSHCCSRLSDCISADELSKVSKRKRLKFKCSAVQWLLLSFSSTPVAMPKQCPFATFHSIPQTPPNPSPLRLYDTSTSIPDYSTTL